MGFKVLVWIIRKEPLLVDSPYLTESKNLEEFSIEFSQLYPDFPPLIKEDGTPHPIYYIQISNSPEENKSEWVNALKSRQGNLLPGFVPIYKKSDLVKIIPEDSFVVITASLAGEG